MKTHHKCLYKVQIKIFVVFIIKIELKTSKLFNPIIQDPSIEFDGLNEYVSFGWVSLSSNVSSALLGVCFKSVSQFLVIETKKSSVSSLSLIIFRFRYLFYFT